VTPSLPSATAAAVTLHFGRPHCGLLAASKKRRKEHHDFVAHYAATSILLGGHGEEREGEVAGGAC
jgi:hypothetical protein